MSADSRAPAPVPFEQAQAAVERDLPIVLGGRSCESVGWQRPDPLTLYVPLRAYTSDTGDSSYGFKQAPTDTAESSETVDEYLLRLYFSYYPQWPPSALFVNPSSKRFGAGDKAWLPMITGAAEVYVHEAYGATGTQLICCSATLEFYLVNHDVQEKHRWKPGSSFAITLNTLSRYLRPPHYTGRQQ